MERYVVEAEVSIDDPGGKLTFCMGEGEHNFMVVLGSMWPVGRDAGITQPRAYLFRNHGLGVSWRESQRYSELELGRQHHFSIFISDREAKLYIDGVLATALNVSGEGGIPPVKEPHFHPGNCQLRIASDGKVNATIHNISIRRATVEEVSQKDLSDVRVDHVE